MSSPKKCLPCTSSALRPHRSAATSFHSSTRSCSSRTMTASGTLRRIPPRNTLLRVRSLPRFLVDGFELLVGRLQLLVHRLEFLVGRLQFLVGRFKLLDRRLQFLVG